MKSLVLSIWKILTGVGKNPTICDVMDRQTAGCIGAHNASTVNLLYLLPLPQPSVKAPSLGTTQNLILLNGTNEFHNIKNAYIFMSSENPWLNSV